MAARTGRPTAVACALSIVAATAALIAGPLAAPAAAAALPGRTVVSLQPDAGSSGHAVVVLGDGRRVYGGSAGADFGLYRTTSFGTRDDGFGTDGFVTTDFGGRVDQIRALARGLSYEVVAAGSSSGDMALARYTIWGALDPGFGNQGRVLTDLGGTDDAAYGVVVQPSGKVVAVGGNGSSTAVIRYNVDGTPDTTFGQGGRVSFPWGRPARAILAQPDGALVVVGGGGVSVDVARLDANGGLDPSFGTAGVVRLVTGLGSSANAAVLLADGRLLVAGARNGNILLVRLLPTGGPDPTFGASGIAEVDFGRNETANGVAMAPDGRIHVVGEATDGSGFTSVHLPGGSLDSGRFSHLAGPQRAVAFDVEVRVFVGTSGGLMGVDGGGMDFSVVLQSASAAVRQADGRVVVAGATSGVTGVVRFTTDGALDPSFGIGGKVVCDLALRPAAVAVQAGGRIVVAGRHDGFVALVGFRPDGSVDPTFGIGGRAVTDAGDETPSALSVLPDGKLLVGGDEETGTFLARFSVDGVPDPTFGDGGVLRGAFPSQYGRLMLLRQPDGKTLATGLGAGISRFNSDGSLDVGFGAGGTRARAPDEMEPALVALQPDGRILVAGPSFPYFLYPFTVMRLLPDGSRDPSWSMSYFQSETENVNSHADSPLQLFVQPDGAVLAVGQSGAARYRSDGTLDTEFGTRGVMTFDHRADRAVDAFLDPGGQLWSVGSSDYYWPRGFTLAVNGFPELSRFHAVVPARILDTRTGNGAPVARVGPGSTVRLQVTGRGGIPSAGVSGVVLNLTVTEPSDGTFLTAWPAGAVRPLASNLNVAAGQTLPNLVTAAVGAGGGVDIYNNRGFAHLIADVAGWYGAGAATGGAHYHPVAPARVLDTRTGNGAPGTAPVGAGATLDLQIGGREGVPATGVSAVVMNLTAVGPTAGTYVTAWPTGQARPLASNLNVVAGQTAPNLVAVAVGAGGKVSLYNFAGAVDLVADVAGWFGDGTESSGARFHPLSPGRILDTRDGTGAPPAPLNQWSALDLQVTGRGGVPAVDVSAVVLNVTVTQPTASTHLTLWPSGGRFPLASNLNFVPGQTVANLVTVAVGSNGRVSISNAAGSSHVVVDVAGWYRG